MGISKKQETFLNIKDMEAPNIEQKEQHIFHQSSSYDIEQDIDSESIASKSRKNSLYERLPHHLQYSEAQQQHLTVPMSSPCTKHTAQKHRNSLSITQKLRKNSVKQTPSPFALSPRTKPHGIKLNDCNGDILYFSVIVCVTSKYQNAALNMESKQAICNTSMSIFDTDSSDSELYEYECSPNHKQTKLPTIRAYKTKPFDDCAKTNNILSNALVDPHSESLDLRSSDDASSESSDDESCIDLDIVDYDDGICKKIKQKNKEC